MIETGSYVLVTTAAGCAVAANVVRIESFSLLLMIEDGDLGLCAGLQLPEDVELEFVRSGDATYRVAAELTSMDPEHRTLTLTRIAEPERMQLRQFARVELCSKVRVSELGVDRSTKVRGTFTGFDISAGGIGLIVPDEVDLPTGTEVSCCFDLPTRQGDLTMMVEATVVRRVAGRCGLQFRDLGERLEQALVAAVNWQQLRSRVR